VLAKFANGVADDFLTSTYLACTAPVLVAPAMNTTMWQHPATRRNVEKLLNDGVTFVEPDAGEMACGTIGPGRLSQPDRIVTLALELLNKRASTAQSSSDLSGERFLITAGGTREEIDPVRFISNRSSGRMGFAIAEAARRRGAVVTVIAGTTSAPVPTDVNIIRSYSAEEMFKAVASQLGNATVFVAAAAVADYRPSQKVEHKIKKTKDSLTLTLEKTHDILAHVASSRNPNQVVIGFAAETDNVLENAREKLRRKRLDLIVANDVSRTDAGFDTEDNAVTLLDQNGTQTELPLSRKIEIADRILDEIIRLRNLRRSESAAANFSNS
jgi:phosphopantothenoylcysteine decarboxylase/phosphopantothenate--cysteine ligase